ncbi:MAG: hypothetical protein JRE23_17415 [Deltaproteobacteria bacterium]|nr:hypothetical protein [Deltaproteobacteria bacterium]
MLEYYDELHTRILREFASITQDELQTPSKYWEDTPMAVDFRLHRFDSHLRQHSVQVEKTLAALSFFPSEAMRLLRLVYNALAEVEGKQIGDWETGAERCRSLAETITKRTDEIEEALNK